MPGPETTEPATTPDKSGDSWGVTAADERKMKAEGDDALVSLWSDAVDFLSSQGEPIPPFVSATGDKVFEARVNEIIGNRIREISDNPELVDRGAYVHKSNEPTPPPQVNNVAQGADPVDLFNGNFRYEATDLRLEGASVCFTFTRTYSQLASYQGPLGASWDHAYNLWIRVEPGQRVLRRSNGSLSEERYLRHDQHGYWIPPPGVAGVVVEVSSSFEYRAPDGTRIVYEPHASRESIHVVSAIVDPFGNAITFRYSDGLLTEARVGHVGRTVRFSYDSEDRIIAIRDFTGRTWRYAYDDMGDLVAVTTPTTARHPRGLSSRYDYLASSVSDRSLQHCLVTVFDADGRAYLENEYGDVPNLVSYRRVVRQRQGSGDYVFDYADVVEPFERDYALHERPTHETRVRDRAGRESRYLFNANGNMLLKETSARVDGMPTRLAWHYRYNADGNLIGSWSPLGVVSQALYGRDLYERRQADGDRPPPELDPDLTRATRQGFDNLLAVVHRAHYRSSPTALASGLWANAIFPDIFDVSSEDVVQKLSYDETLALPLTVSDPRFTQSPDPGFAEDAEHHRHLTHYVYGPGHGFPRLFLERVERPTPTLPDGSAAGPVVTRFAEHDPQGRVVRAVAPNGLETVSNYAGSSAGVLEGFLTDIVADPGGEAIRLGFERDALGRIIKVLRPSHFLFGDDRFAERRSYDDLDQLIESRGTAPMSIGVSCSHTRAGAIERVEVELKDENHDLRGTMTSRLRYGEELELVRRTVGDGIAERTEKLLYDRDGRLFFHIGPSGRRTKASFEDRGLVTRLVTDYGGVNATTRCHYDADGRQVRFVDARGNVTRRILDVWGRPIEVEDALGNRQLSTYDKLGNLIVARSFERRADGSFALLQRTETSYDELGRAIAFGVNRFEDPPIVPANEVATAFREAGPGRLVSRQRFYDASGNLERQVDPLGNVTRATYDTLGRLAETTDPDGNQVRLRHDVEGNVIRVEAVEVVRDAQTGDPIGAHHFAQTFAYDEQNRLVGRATPLGSVGHRYDSRGNRVVSRDYLGNLSRYHFDSFGRLERVDGVLHQYQPGELPVPVLTTFTYNADDNLTRQVDALGRGTEFLYDSAGRLVSTVLPDGTFDLRAFDRAGNLIEHRDRAGISRSLTWDAVGRNTRTLISSTDGTLPGAKVYVTAYDGVGRVRERRTETIATEWRYDSLGLPVEETTTFNGIAGVSDGTRHVTRRAFDDRGALTAVELPSGRTATFERDALARIVRVDQTARSVDHPGDLAAPVATTLAAYAYEGLRVKRVERGNGLSTELDYDIGGRVSQIRHLSQGQAILTTQLLHDALGNLRQKLEVSDDLTATESFRYDSLSRIIEATSSHGASLVDVGLFAPPASPLADVVPNLQQAIDARVVSVPPAHLHRYELDLVGNRVSTELDGDTKPYASNDLDQYESVGGEQLRYDLSGNLIEDSAYRYGYDSNNQLCTLLRKADGRQVQWFLDASGRRCVETSSAGTSLWSFDGATPIEQRWNGQLIRSLIATPRQDDFVVSSIGGRDQTFLCDATGSVRYVFASDGSRKFYVYDEFGRVTQTQAGPDDNPFRFASKRLVADTAKYDFQYRVYDPAMGRFLQRDPLGFVDGTNLYAFARGNPFAFRDPMGLESRQERGGPMGPTGNPGNALAARAGSSLVRKNPRGFTMLVPDAFDDAKIAATKARIQNPADRGAGIRGKPAGGGKSRTKDLRDADKQALEAWFDALPADQQATRGRGATQNHVDHETELQSIIRPHPDAPGANKVLPGSYRLQNSRVNSSQGSSLAALNRQQVAAGAPEDTPAGGIARVRDAAKIQNQPWFRSVMRNLGYYNLLGGTGASLSDFGDNIRDGDWISAAMNGSSAAGGMLEIGGLVTRSAALLRYARFLGTPAAVVGSGVMGWQVGTHLYDNYVDKERAMSAGEWVERKTGSRVLGAAAASWMAVQDATWSIPEAAIDFAGRTWTLDPDEIDWGKTARPWRWLD